MADEERVLEDQLELQLNEQRDSLSALNDALASDPFNPQILAVHGELVEVIKETEEGLLNLKRARLLREADLALDVSNQSVIEDVKAEPLDPEEKSYQVGSKCRFRYSDGRWYEGQVVALNGSGSAKISFLTPTSENMLICKFFLQQRCRFGASCRLSHGVDVPLTSLKKYASTMWEPSMVGSSIWAVSDGKVGIWREAELESWNDELRTGKVVFRDDGSSAELGIEALTLSEYAQMSGDEESELSSEESDSSDSDEEDSPRGIGFLESTARQRGIQTETTVFAKWENHTRGVASKMMANMGYREGMGLGASGQGMLDPISVKVLPPKLSLDHALESHQNDEGKEKKDKKRSRGGKRKREKKFAEAARAAKEEEESRPDVFSLINNQLAMHNEAVNGGSRRKQQKKGSGEEKKVDRKALVAYDDEVKELKLRVVKLEEMASRNRNEKAVYGAAMRKLDETRKALADAEAVHASASNAVASKEKEKKWLKF
ncbi:Zinc finger CCCH domain-containing protein 18 [Hibiscus syriacus]|uniref:Zinc finger CCCH domain-containing protein 18 n=1 Tax=Hibiscus syriacus TaxID=106335 RepID=A0A6A2YSZ8_HIBSY|nr:zinc finger CCCH domain-containing protein 22-like [Hibiscus syriacus]KAE8682544.1 Zinc finger CCCH domain-containing protein 18 [Hibiscus syriacus]